MSKGVDSESYADVMEALLQAKGPKASLQERQALAQVESELFGRTNRVIALSRYVLLDRLGAGGAGVVYRGYDPELDRKIAIKLLQSGSEAGDVEGRLRLLREAQAMAKIAHPNVIAVYDVGSYDERDLGLNPSQASSLEIPLRGIFVVMELVEGPDLRTWLASKPRSVREIIGVFAAAGQGLAAAHERGLTHRDFKPANVLVGRDGRVRVLDFGLARAHRAVVEPEAPSVVSVDRSLDRALDRALTITGTVMGTPRYMSPEQHIGKPSDARSDQYSFCLALCEALYGEPPFQANDLEQLARAKWAGPVELGSGPAGLAPKIRRALTRGLMPKPEDRFADMPALLSSLNLDGHRWRWWAAAGVGTLAIAGLAWSMVPGATDVCAGYETRLEGVWDDAVRSSVEAGFSGVQKPFAADALAHVEQHLDEYSQQWLTLRRETCQAAIAGGDAQPEVMELRILCLDRRLQGLRQVVEVLRDADASVVERAAETVAQLPPVAACLSEQEAGSDDLPPAGPDREAALAIDAELQRAAALLSAGRYEDSLEVARSTLEDARALGHPATVVEALLRTSSAHQSLSRLDEAEAMVDEALVVAERAGSGPLVLRAMLNRVAVVGITQARYPEADLEAERVLARFSRDPPDPPLEAQFSATLAVLRNLEGRYDAGLVLVERSLTLYREGHGTKARIAAALNTRGNILANQGRYTEARAAHDEALKLRREIYGPHHPEAARSLNNIGLVLAQQGRLQEAYDINGRALEIQTAAFSDDHEQVLLSMNNSGVFLRKLGRMEEALAVHKEVYQRSLRRFGPDHTQIGPSLDNIGGCLVDLGRHAEALAYIQKSIEVRERNWGPNHIFLADLLRSQGEALIAVQRHADAVPPLERALQIVSTQPNPEARMRGVVRVRLAEALGHRDAKAPGLLREAIDDFAQAGDQDGREQAEQRLAEIEQAPG